MIEIKNRLHHCHKIGKHIFIQEDYEVETAEGRPTLKRWSCPVYTGTQAGGVRCNGLNEHGRPCAFAQGPES